jgi:hypothetical protein
MNNQISNPYFSLPTLVILILIILQFSKKRSQSESRLLVDNSILFIIAIYFLSCCNKCTI